MVNLTYDLHIHSCLSPCGDDDMTPANIAGMAFIKGLDVIAVTDHNSCKNCYSVLKACEEYGILAIPGMELCTSEEVHVLCLFPDLKPALDFDAYIYQQMLPFPNKEKIFGRQLLYDEKDEVIGAEPLLLISSTNISFHALPSVVADYGGLMIPAHIDKNSNSLLSNLGFIPPDSTFETAEVKDLKNLHRLRREHPYLEGCRIISNSDAHYLQDINEPVLSIQAKSRDAGCVLAALRAGV